MNAATPEPWTCPSCAADAGVGRFCASCGERRLDAHDRKLVGLLEQWFESLFHVDGRIVRTLKTLVAEPGELTASHARGRRKPFVGPLQLFLAVNVVFFFAQLVTGLNALSTPLSTHLHGMVYGSIAQRWVDAHLAAHGTTLADFAPVFDAREQSIAKVFVIAMAPLLAGLAALLFVRRREPAPVHFVFALHFYAFVLLFLTVFFPLLGLALLVCRKAGVEPTPALIDDVATAIEALAIGAWFFGAVRRVYGVRGVLRALATGALLFGVFYILVVYRFVLLALTLFVLR